jgi:hypothetical protein
MAMGADYIHRYIEGCYKQGEFGGSGVGGVAVTDAFTLPFTE